MHFEQTIRPLITELISNTRLLVAQLKMDQIFLEKNDITQIEESNAKKITLNTTLLAIINTLIDNPQFTISTGNVFERMQNYAHNLPFGHKKWLLDQLKTLNEEIPTYNQIMLVNRTILHSNLAHIKDFFCTITTHKNSSEPSIYKPSGTSGSMTISLE